MFESEDVDCYEDASSEMVREAKEAQRRKLWAVTFTSEVFQTLIDDQTTVRLSTPPMFESSQMANERETREASVLGISEVIQRCDLTASHTCIIAMHEAVQMRYLYLKSLVERASSAA